MSSDGRILTTHAGSLPRPAALVELYARRANGEAIDEAALAREIDRATAWVVPKQIAAGLDLINNGEQSREAFFLYVRHRMSGFAPGGVRSGPADVARYPAYQELRQRFTQSKPMVTNFAVPQVVGEVRYLDPASIENECEDFGRVLASLPDAAGPEGAFMTAPSPGIIAAAIPNRHYDTFEAYVDALAEALRVEYEAIAARGYLLQIDCPDLALERHITYADRPVSEFVAFVELIVDAINRSLVNVPRDRVRMHVCWGNYEGPHDLDVPLADILPALLHADVSGLVLPFANPRHAHEYRVLEQYPLAADQHIVAGVIDTTTNYIEHPEVVADRLERVARAVGSPARVVAGTDCGFDTSAGMGRVAEDVVWAKLSAMAAGARIATERLC